MINALLQGLFNFLISLIETVLTPIDTLIQQNIPDLSNALDSFNSLLTYIINFIGFVVDASGLSSIALGLIVAYMSFALTVPLIVWVIKVLVKWWHALAP